MNSSVFCVYNLARRVSLSSKVTIADAVNQPLKVLKDLVGLEAESGLWLNPLTGTPTIPKLFPYDLAYLDQELCVIDMVEVSPGVEFPPYRTEVKSAVALPPDTLRRTQTHRGDHLVVCRQTDLDSLLQKQNGSPRKADPGPIRQPVVEEGKPAQPQFTAAKEGSPETSPSGMGVEVQIPSNAAQVLRGIEQMDTDAQEAEAPSDSSNAPTVSITEVVIEQPHPPPPHLQPALEHRAGLEDLFANWVDSPTAPPSWIAQKAREHESEKVSASSTPPPIEPVPSESAQSSPQSAETAPNPPVAPVSFTPPAKTPPSASTIQPIQQTTFTIAGYGMWQARTPTSLPPTSPGKRPANARADDRTQTKESTGAKRAEAAKPESQPGGSKPAGLRAGGTKAVSPPRAKTSEIAAPAGQTSPEMKTPEEISTSATQPREVPSPKVLLPGAVSGHAREAESSIPKAESAIGSTQQVGSTAKPSPADFAASVQDRLERLQLTSEPPSATQPAAPEPMPVAQERFETAKPEPAVREKPPQPGMAGQPVAKPAGQANGLDPQPEVSKAAPRFPKTKTDETSRVNNAVERNGKNQAGHDGLGARLKRWLKPALSAKSDRRRALRRYVPGMVVHYYTGGAPTPHDIADISMTGLYVLTEDRWVPETMIRMTLQKPCSKGERKQSITVLSRVVRRGSDGVAAEFVTEESLDPSSRDVLPSQATDRFALARFL